VSATVEALGSQVVRFVEQALALDALDDTAAVNLLVGLRALKRDLSVLDDELVQRIAAGHRNNDVIADGRATVRWSAAKQEWDRDAARRAILSLEQEIAVASGDAAVMPDTGEKVATWQQAVDVVSKFWLLGNPRTTPMVEAGLDPNEFRSMSNRRPRVDLT